MTCSTERSNAAMTRDEADDLGPGAEDGGNLHQRSVVKD